MIRELFTYQSPRNGVRTALNFRLHGNLSACRRKFISVQAEIYQRAHENFSRSLPPSEDALAALCRRARGCERTN
jgi:hypothetical protein